MAASFKYWDDCVDPEDLEAMWRNSRVRAEWISAGEIEGQKVHLSRDPDGQPYLTQTEMKAVVDTVVRNHFKSKMDPGMICAIAELESDRRPLATRYDKKAKETYLGIMQLSQKTAERIVKEMGYRAYEVEGNTDILFRPFVSVYFGAAYLQHLSNFDCVERSEEFVVRAYKGGIKKATHKSTLPYWRRYLSVKESLPSRKIHDDAPSPSDSPHAAEASGNTDPASSCWESIASQEDIEEMWNIPAISKEWSKSGISKEWSKSVEKRGKVPLSFDAEKRAYLSRVELKAIAEIIVSKHFSTKGIKPVVLCAVAEIVSMRLMNGIRDRPGIMGVNYSTAFWLYLELGYRAYKVDSDEDLKKPFISMYFGAAYIAWLSEYEGRERSPQFVLQAYISGPKNVNLQEPGPMWLKFEEALSTYELFNKRRSHGGSCSVM